MVRVPKTFLWCNSYEQKMLGKVTACVPQYRFPGLRYGEPPLELPRILSYLICFDVEITLKEFNTLVLLTS